MEHEASPWIFFGMSVFVIVLLTIVSVLATRRLSTIPESRSQNLVELIVSSLNNFVVGIVGHGGEKYTPFIGTIFIYVLTMNLLGLIPGFKSPTGNLSVTLGLAVVVFVMYNFYGIKAVGARAYFMHLMGEPLWLAPLMLPIHIIGEIARPVSLSIRLFGNIFGEETIIAILAGMSFVILRVHQHPVLAVPFQFPMMVFAVFTAFVQALVFAMLSTIYIAMATSGHSEEHAS